MICPTCNEQMKHINKWWWHSSTDSYQTYDFVHCTTCNKKAIEFYHTEFIDNIDGIHGEELPCPNFKLKYIPNEM